MSAWDDLLNHRDSVCKTSLQELHDQENDRSEVYRLDFAGLCIDFSRNQVSRDTVGLLLKLADETSLTEKIRSLFNGDEINQSEQRPALHFALRNSGAVSFNNNNQNISEQIMQELDRVSDFVTDIQSGSITGHSNKKITDIVNIGIGGSELGPKLLHDALKPYWQSDINIHFLANIDADEFFHLLKRLNPEQTLFVVSSKSFTTNETMLNASRARQWLLDHDCRDISKHMVAVTANVRQALNFGITEPNIFRIWDWVGGRYSVWSAISLAAMAKIGVQNFKDFLAGAHLMDQHFMSTPFRNNIPVMLGLLDVWSINFLGNNTLAIIPYSSSLAYLPAYLSQLFMESNGKNLDQQQRSLSIDSGAVIWGGVGTNVQHAFMQLLHQGTRSLPVEFLVGTRNHFADSNYQRHLYANCIAQGEALMRGSQTTEPGAFNHVSGNKPSTTIIYDLLTPATLGMLLAMYEHRVFVQASIWDINPFDQWGVELGKKLSEKILTESGDQDKVNLDSTTQSLLQYFNSRQN